MKKTILISLIVLLILAVGAYFYLYKGHRDIQREKAAFELTSEKLVHDFQTDQSSANQNYLNQTIEISGIVKESGDSTLLLNPGVFCAFSNSVKENLVNQNVNLKCRCIGYDELFGEVKLDQCSILNK